MTQSLVEGEAERDLPGLVEKYRAIEKQSGKRVQICIADYDETTYNFLDLGTAWTHGFWRMVNHATARKLREQGFLVRFVSLDLDDYMAWLAQENLHDSSASRAQFAAAKADSEMGIKSAVPAPGSEPRGETPTRQASADMQCDIRRRDRWTRLTKTTALTVAVVALAAFVGGHNSRAPNHPSDIAVARSPEVRRAIPVEPEIRKAIPVQTWEAGTRSANRNRWRSPLRERQSRASLQHDARPPTRHGGKAAKMMRSANARYVRSQRLDFSSRSAAFSDAMRRVNTTPRLFGVSLAICLCLSIPAQAKLGETVPQLIKRFGKIYKTLYSHIGNACAPPM